MLFGYSATTDVSDTTREAWEWWSARSRGLMLPRSITHQARRRFWRVGDAIRSINGVVLNGSEDLRAELARYQLRNAIVLEIERASFPNRCFEME